MIPIFLKLTSTKAGLSDTVKIQLGSELWAVCRIIGENTKDRYFRLQIEDLFIAELPDKLPGIEI